MRGRAEGGVDEKAQIMIKILAGLRELELTKLVFERSKEWDEHISNSGIYACRDIAFRGNPLSSQVFNENEESVQLIAGERGHTQMKDST